MAEIVCLQHGRCDSFYCYCCHKFTCHIPTTGQCRSCQKIYDHVFKGVTMNIENEDTNIFRLFANILTEIAESVDDSQEKINYWKHRAEEAEAKNSKTANFENADVNGFQVSSNPKHHQVVPKRSLSDFIDPFIEKCNLPAESFIPRWGMSWACVRPKGHFGPCAKGGNCFMHGEYIGDNCPDWPACGGVPANTDLKDLDKDRKKVIKIYPRAIVAKLFNGKYVVQDRDGNNQYSAAFDTISEAWKDAASKVPIVYDPTFGDAKLCACGHIYHGHFDRYDCMKSIGCKYCWCKEWIQPK